MKTLEDLIESGRIVLIATPNLGPVESMCSRALLMDRGRLVMDDTPQEVIHLCEQNLG